MTTLAPSSTTSPEVSESPSTKQARIYLNNLLCKTLLVHTTDHRMFRGEFKCTDSDLNIILSETYEYRIPPAPPQPQDPNSTTLQPQSQPQPLLNITPRWLGLVVVPGAHILRIELEEFESQVRGRKS
ncbi:hypothetical protein BOTCAL_0029g00410 [Botryotinia calthae]|uniref:Sm domain-containing protein n=1 Tax=Botryotinia calthae TaxID=38488 RepID=A0A4Y8DFX6_9HELO|nr:hypothetical protein BOTCAL_0029g00410 [Botryotinia calthae]